MYLTVKEHDLAINMYKKNRKYDQMIRLVSTFRKDLLVETHLHLAQQLEADGSFKDAEKHFLEAKDWKSVVQMYRAAELWDDAIRIARNMGGANASKQVAYAWAVALGGEQGAALLGKFGLVEQAIDYAMESGAFPHAFELTRCSPALKHKLPEVHLKFAMYLEDEGRFKEAEEEFLAADKPKEAIDMYVHQQDWVTAMRVAEAYDPSAVSEVQMAQARVYIERKEHNKAEAMFVKAKRPELAIKMYKDGRMWEDAIRVAEDYLPSKVQEIHLELAASMAGTGGGGGGATTAESVVARYKLLERQGAHSQAIDVCLLEMNHELTADTQLLQKAWGDAVNMAMDHCRQRSQEVVSTVAVRLVGMGKHQAAAEAYMGIDAFKEAIEVYAKADMWDKAKAIGGQQPQFSGLVEQLYTNHLQATGQAGALADTGNTGAALEMYARQGEWDKVHELASEQGPDMVSKYAFIHAKQEVQRGRFKAASAVFAKCGAPAVPANFDLYKHIAHEILTGSGDPQADVELKGMLQRLVKEMSLTPEVYRNDLHVFVRHLEVAHFNTLRVKAKAEGWNDLAAKTATALLRYVTLKLL
jgi:intraflagellar transport protein 172